MKTNQREILIYYNPSSSNDKKTVAHAQGVSKHVRTYAFTNAQSTSMSWRQILKSLNMHPKELLNKAHPYYQANIRGKDFSSENWLRVLMNNPDLIKAPIAIRGNRAILCTNSTDIYRLA